MCALRVAISLVCCLLVARSPAQAPSPTDFFGHEIGADYELVDYTDMVRYYRAVEQASDRVRLFDIGQSSYGQRMVMAVITSKANQERLARLRDISVAMAHPERDRDEPVGALRQDLECVLLGALHGPEHPADEAERDPLVEDI